VISEAAVTTGFTTCPSAESKNEIIKERRQLVFVWLRLEGDALFASSAAAAGKFRVRLHRTGALREHWTQVQINNDRLALSGIQQEASLPANNGFFDWRLYARIGDVPTGTYRIAVSYGQTRVCPITGECEIVFNVKSGD